MKVAIMGAGLSGLACGITLEKYGINPEIYEKRSSVGDRFVNSEIMLKILNRPINDTIAFFSEKFDINLYPIRHLTKMLLCSEHEKAEITGRLGFSDIRGRDSDSFECQLARQIKSKIKFKSNKSYEHLLQDYTHVVMATGDASYAAEMHNYQEDTTVTLKGAMVEGKFDPYTVAAWLDNRFAPNGYGYLIPISETEANITIVYPDYPENRPEDVDKWWNLFFDIVCMEYKQTLRITDHFQVTRYIIGICKSPRIGNTFFTGNCFGSIMPLFGFGQVSAILTGVYAAMDICGKGNYEELTRNLRSSYENSLVLRRSVEQLDNHKLDIIVKALGSKLGNRIFNTKRDPLKLASYLLRPLVLNKHRKV